MIADGSPPTTRLSTALACEGWTNRVISFASMENCPQLMMALALLLTCSVWGMGVVKAALPLTTWGLAGLALSDPGHPRMKSASKVNTVRLGMTCTSVTCIALPKVWIIQKTRVSD